MAHALVQARDEVAAAMDGFPDDLLWIRVSGLASVGFHLQHLAGVLDRLFTYAEGRALDAAQLSFLESEATPRDPTTTVAELVRRFEHEVDRALGALGRVREETLQDARQVGRRGLPSTVHGLLFHAAEHTMRHTGQLIVTARVVRARGPIRDPESTGRAEEATGKRAPCNRRH